MGCGSVIAGRTSVVGGIGNRPENGRRWRGKSAKLRRWSDRQRHKDPALTEKPIIDVDFDLVESPDWTPRELQRMRGLRDHLRRKGHVMFKGVPTRAEQFVLDEWARARRTPEQQEAYDVHLRWLATQNDFDRRVKAAEKREPFSYHVRKFIYIWSNFLGLAVAFAILVSVLVTWAWMKEPEPRPSWWVVAHDMYNR